MPRNENLTWNEVDVETMKPATKKLYAAYKAAAGVASEKRKEFDEAFEKDIRKLEDVIETHQTFLVTHKFGKLSFAVSDEAPKSGAKAKKFAFS